MVPVNVFPVQQQKEKKSQHQKATQIQFTVKYVDNVSPVDNENSTAN
jgi:hypothetical protein